jgi:Domain of unknown function (DUF6378)/Domain of unknown function (DUF4406)
METLYMETLYLCGKMSGLSDFGFALFNSEAIKLRALGYTVINPAETDNGSTDKSWGYYMKKDIAIMVACDALVTLPNWKDSKGAKIEVSLARDLAIPVLDTNLVEIDFDKPNETICQEADRLVSHDRQDTYGHPFDNFSHTGKLWAPILGLEKVTPQQVALCMIQVKVSRECFKPKRDNLVDINGYAKCLSVINDKRLNK